MNYGEIFTKSWRITWKNKILWLFALLASCATNGGGGGGSGNYSGSIPTEDYGGSSGAPLGDMEQAFNEFGRWIENIDPMQIILIIGAVILVLLIINIALYLLGLTGLNGLIHGAWRADEGQERLALGELFRAGTHSLLRVFLMRFLVGLAIFVVILLIMLPIIGVGIATEGIGMVALIPFIIAFACCAVFFAIALEFFLNLANIAIVGEDISIVAGAKRAWKIIQKGIGPLLLVAVIIFIGGGIIHFVLSLPIIMALIPMIIGSVAWLGTEDISGFLAGSAVSIAVICLYTPVLLLASSILTTYTETLWVLSYKRIAALPDRQLPQAQPVDAAPLQ